MDSNKFVSLLNSVDSELADAVQQINAAVDAVEAAQEPEDVDVAAYEGRIESVLDDFLRFASRAWQELQAELRTLREEASGW